MTGQQHECFYLLFLRLSWNWCVVSVSPIKAPLTIDPLCQHERRSCCNGLQKNSGSLPIGFRFEVQKFLTQTKVARQSRVNAVSDFFSTI